MDLKNITPIDINFKKRVQDSFARQKFMTFINAELIKIQPGYCEIKLPFTESLTQQHKYFHAGIIAAIADNAAGYAAFSLMHSTSTVLTVEYKINFVAPAKGDFLVAKASVLKKGGTLIVCQAEVFAQNHSKLKLCSVMQSTLMELKNKKDS